MDRRKVITGLGALWTPVMFDRPSIDTAGPATRRQASQAPNVVVDDLIRTPPLATELSRASVTLSRLTYEHADELEIHAPGPIACYIQSGSLAMRYEPGNGLAVLYSGPDQTPPPMKATADGLTSIPSGYAVFAENGDIGLTRNDSDEQAVVLAVSLIPGADEGASAGSEEVATPKSR